MKLKSEDQVVGMSIIGEEAKKSGVLFIVTERGYGKCTKLSQYKVQNRGGSGIRTAKITSKTGKLVFARGLTKDELKKDLVIISEKGQVIRLGLNTCSVLGRDTQGVRLMRFKSADDQVASTAFMEYNEEEITKEVEETEKAKSK